MCINVSLSSEKFHTFVISLQVDSFSFFFCFGNTVSGSAGPHGTTKPSQEEELTPVDLDDEELAAYAEECAALADFDDIPEEELFSWSDFDEPDQQGYDMDVA